MKYFLTSMGFIFCLFPGILRAVPATLENSDYKVTLSESMPGLDNQLSLQAPPTIMVAVQDKFHGSGTNYPLNVYAIPHYFLSGNSLNLLCRINLMSSQTGPRYSFIQLNFASSTDSRQFQPLKQYYFSPDEQYLLAVFDGEGKSDSIALLQLNKAPAQLGWLYTQKGRPSLFRGTGKGEILLQAPVGWSADSGTAAFVVSVDEGEKDAKGNPILKDYLAGLQVSQDEFKVSTDPVDLSPYHFHNGGVLVKVQCVGDKVTLFFTQADSSENLTAVFPLPKPTQSPAP